MSGLTPEREADGGAGAPVSAPRAVGHNARWARCFGWYCEHISRPKLDDALAFAGALAAEPDGYVEAGLAAVVAGSRDGQFPVVRAQEVVAIGRRAADPLWLSAFTWCARRNADVYDQISIADAAAEHEDRVAAQAAITFLTASPPARPIGAPDQPWIVLQVADKIALERARGGNAR